MSEDGERVRYTFGDSATASERLGRVARVFAPSSEAFLARLPGPARRRVLDIGCGPGHTSRMLARAFPDAAVCGLDQSDAFLAEARGSASPRTSFEQADVGVPPLPSAPADLIFARFVLSHLRDRETALRAWFDALSLAGLLAVEEVDVIDTDDRVFADYLAITSGLMADRGGALYVGRELATAMHALGGRVVIDGASSVAPATAEIATIFELNLQSWRNDPWVTERHDRATLDALAAALRERRAAGGAGAIRWTLRQVAVER